jgi:hypothetical protein
MKQYSVGGQVAPLGHIILILRQPVFVLTPLSCVRREVAAYTNLIIFGFTRTRLEPTIYHTRGEHANNFTTDAVNDNICLLIEWD